MAPKTEPTTPTPPPTQPPPPLVGSSTESPPPAKPVAVSVDGREFDFNVFDADAAKAHQEAARAFEVVTSELRNGEFSGVPNALVMANYHFVRIGIKGLPATEKEAARFRARGYVDAPPGVRAVGSGYVDEQHIMCARPEAFAALRDEKLMRAKRRTQRLHKGRLKEIEDSLRASLPRGTQLSVAATMSQGTSGSFEDDLRAVERDMRRRT